jgi:hypothetical protein
MRVNQFTALSLLAVLLSTLPTECEENKKFSCTGNVRCEIIRLHAEAMLGKQHPRISILTPDLWQPKHADALVTHTGYEINPFVYIIAEHGNIASIIMSTDAFQTRIFDKEYKHPIGEKFDEDATIATLSEVRGFVRGWKEAHKPVGE